METPDIKQVLLSQYRASLAMLEQVIQKCPAELWDDPSYRNRTWHLVYHALFYTHLYLNQTEEDFRAWEKHRPEYNFMGSVPWPPHDPPKIGEPFTAAEMLEYLAFLQKEIEVLIGKADLHAGSGFDWLPFSKIETMLYTLRHLMQHNGELAERLGTRYGMEFDWVGRK